MFLAVGNIKTTNQEKNSQEKELLIAPRNYQIILYNMFTVIKTQLKFFLPDHTFFTCLIILPQLLTNIINKSQLWQIWGMDAGGTATKKTSKN